MVKFSEKIITCKHPGCGERIFAKDLFNHTWNTHSDFLEAKTEGCIIAVKEDVSSPNFACAFCLVKNNVKLIRTYQNMRSHQRKHHRGEIILKTKSELKDLLAVLTFHENGSYNHNNDDGNDDDDDDNDNDCNNDHCGNDNCRRALSAIQQENQRLHKEIDALKAQLAPIQAPMPITMDSTQPAPIFEPTFNPISPLEVAMDSTQPAPIFEPTFDPISPMEKRKTDDIKSLISMINSGNHNVRDLVKERERMLRSYKLMPIRAGQLSDAATQLATSTVPCMIKAIAWVNVLMPHTMTTPFKVFDVGSGTGKSGHSFAILTEGLAKVLGFEIYEKDCYFSMRDSAACNHYLPDNKRMETQFLAVNEDILNVTSADGFDVMFCQVRGMNSDAYQNIAKCYNNSNVQVLLVSCSLSWTNFEAGVIDSGGIRGELVDKFSINCRGGGCNTTFRVYRKTPIPQEWATDVVMQKYVDALDNLTLGTHENHLKELSKKFGKRKRKKREFFTIT